MFHFLYLPSYALLRVTFCVNRYCVSQSKGLTVFCKLELHALSKKTMRKISLNPGLNLTILLGTGHNSSYHTKDEFHNYVIVHLNIS